MGKLLSECGRSCAADLCFNNMNEFVVVIIYILLAFLFYNYVFNTLILVLSNRLMIINK